MKNIKSILCTAAIGLLLVVQLLHPATVFADGEGTPPPTSTPEVTGTPQPTETIVETVFPSGTPEITVTPEETTSPTDVPAVTPTLDPNEATAEPVVTTPIATESATPGAGEPTAEPVVTTPSPTDVPTEEEDETKVAPTDTSTPTAEPVTSEEDSTMEEPSLAEALSEIPAETEVVVLDESGQPEPLATVDAAEAISSGDPVWCPAGQAPTPGLNGCTTSYTTLGELVASEGGNIAADGTIWIASGATMDVNPVVIDGCSTYYSSWCFDFSNWANYSLTLQGGWSGISGDTTIGSNSVFTVPISVDYWWGDVIVNNLTISGTNETGLSVATLGDINGANIISINNQGTGAYFSAMSGEVMLTGMNVFNDNGGAGIYIDPFSGAITLNNVTANNNEGDGIYAVANGSITLNNITANNNNWGNGILAASLYDGDITMNNITANNNLGNGISGTGYGISAFAEGGNITMNNITADYNDWAGIATWTNSGNIAINNISANNNGSYGIGASSDGTIKMDNTLVSGNYIGIAVQCGDVIMSNVEISNNAVGLHTEGIRSINPTGTNFVNNGIEREDFDYPCDAPAPTPAPISIIVRAEGKFTFDCSKQAAYPIQLPNGDLVNIFCPVSGTASIYRLDNTNLPENLPEGYTYASAFTLDIAQQGVPIPVISEGGYVKSSFVAQPLQPGNTYTVLYWDSWVNENGDLVENLAGGSWLPLKDFLLDGDGNTESFDLFPGTDDPRRVISGVNFVDRNGSESIEVSTNFPGIFVLAQH